jgi:sulfite reductase alpha subunit-like flavoprotein
VQLDIEIATTLWKNAPVVDLSDRNLAAIPQLRANGAVVFLLSSHGEGDPSGSVIAFAEWLNASLAPDFLKDPPFAIHGLDSEVMHKTPSILSNLAAYGCSARLFEPSPLHALFSRHLGICNPNSRKAALESDQYAPTAEAGTKVRSITSDQNTFPRYKASYKPP